MSGAGLPLSYANGHQICKLGDPADIKKTFGAADVLGKGCSLVVFEHCGECLSDDL